MYSTQTQPQPQQQPELLTSSDKPNAVAWWGECRRRYSSSWFSRKDRAHGEMTLADDLELPPWTKWTKHGLFPFKMVLHLSLIVLSTTEVLLTSEGFSPYSRSVGQNWVQLFYPDSYADAQSSNVRWNQYYIFTQNDTVSDAQRLVDIYYQLPDLAVDDVNVAGDDAEVTFPRLTVASNSGQDTYILYNSSTGWPLARDSSIISSPTTLQDWTDELDYMRFHFVVKSEQGFGTGRTVCILWNLEYMYDLRSRGQALVTSTYRPGSLCEGQSQSFTQGSITDVIISLILALAAWFQVLLIKATYRSFRILLELKQLYDPSPPNQPNHTILLAHDQQKSRDDEVINQRQPEPSSGHGLFNTKDATFDNSLGIPLLVKSGTVDSERKPATLKSGGRTENDFSSVWQELTWQEKLGVFDLWVMASTTGNIIAFVYCFSALVSHEDAEVQWSQRILLGCSALFYWGAVAQYFEYNPRHYILIVTLQTALPRVGMFLVGIFPFFLGYALLGISLFGNQSDLFGDFEQTLMTLFSVVNGDVILDTFTAIGYVSVVGELYLYVYILLFLYVMLMTIYAIVEEAFFSVNTLAGDQPKDSEHQETEKRSIYATPDTNEGGTRIIPQKLLNVVRGASEIFVSESSTSRSQTLSIDKDSISSIGVGAAADSREHPPQQKLSTKLNTAHNIIQALQLEVQDSPKDLHAKDELLQTLELLKVQMG